jgi:peptidoglycan hydrolase CwlO-like protein
LIEELRAEVDQIRDTLEGVLKDLDEVSENLTRAEHEKDIAEAEIEQLREQIRRLHR